jgi:two-component system CheB/CheR fusion protein
MHELEDKTREQLCEEIEQLRARLEEPEETVSAIRRGEVDAFVLLEPAGERVYTLGTADLLRQLQLITDSLPVLVGYVDRERRYRFVNLQYEVWFGRPLHEIVGSTIAEVLGEAAYAAVREHVDEVLSGRQVTFGQWLDLQAAGNRFVQVTLLPHVHDGELQGYVSFVQDMSERRRAEESLRLLADAGRLLSGSLGSDTMLADAARLVVPALADWCAIELAQDGGGSQRVVSVRSDSGDQPSPTAPSSRLDVQLVAGGRTLGTWSFVYAESGRQHRAEDQAVAEELATRLAVALDNRRLYREVQAANRAKDHFLATLSHELRTPLAPVLAMASRLAVHQDLPAAVRDGLAMIHRNVGLEARLIDDLLDLTRIGRGKLELHRKPTDLRQVVQQALETCDERELAARQVVLDLSAPEHLVWGDPSRLVQVFWNLLNNALKFTPRGGTIRVRSYCEEPSASAPEPGAARQLVVEIADSGVGIEPGELESIFDAFDQGGQETGRRFGGLGLGLAISRAILDLHGGCLSAASAGRHRGATFAVRLPLAVEAAAVERAGAAAGAARETEASSAAVSPLAILLVEDHADTAEAVAQLLQAIGHRVTVAGTVAEALAAAEAAPFDLLVSDLGLPDGAGHELMRLLASRRDPMRGIALSGYGMEADVARSREAGFDLHLVKPVTLEELRAAIERLAAPPHGGERD